MLGKGLVHSRIGREKIHIGGTSLFQTTFKERHINQQKLEIMKKDMIVKYKGKWYRVTRVTANTVNLGGVWTGKVTLKGIPRDEVYEDGDAFYDNWSQSETYQCM